MAKYYSKGDIPHGAGGACPPMGNYECSRCLLVLPLTSFGKRAGRLRQSWCKDCKREYDRATVAKKRAAPTPAHEGEPNPATQSRSVEEPKE